MSTATVRKPRRNHIRVANDPRLFRFSVKIIDGPMTDAFIKANPKVIRVIEMRGDDTLGYLHEMIFEAFNRFDPHLYRFQFGGKRPMDRGKLRFYVMKMMYEEDLEMAFDQEEIAGKAECTTVGSLNLSEKDKFFYWFDFGDDWWHEITVKAIEPQVDAKKKYPRIAEKIGRSPKQYSESAAGMGTQVYKILEAHGISMMAPIEPAKKKKSKK